MEADRPPLILEHKREQNKVSPNKWYCQIFCKSLSHYSITVLKPWKTSHLDGLAPEGLMGAGVPEVNLSILGAGDELLHGGMDIQTP